jgi:hypothetical protein
LNILIVVSPPDRVQIYLIPILALATLFSHTTTYGKGDKIVILQANVPVDQNLSTAVRKAKKKGKNQGLRGRAKK